MISHQHWRTHTSSTLRCGNSKEGGFHGEGSFFPLLSTDDDDCVVVVQMYEKQVVVRRYVEGVVEGEVEGVYIAARYLLLYCGSSEPGADGALGRMALLLTSTTALRSSIIGPVGGSMCSCSLSSASAAVTRAFTFPNNVCESNNFANMRKHSVRTN